MLTRAYLPPFLFSCPHSCEGLTGGRFQVEVEGRPVSMEYPCLANPVALLWHPGSEGNLEAMCVSVEGTLDRRHLPVHSVTPSFLWRVLAEH